MRILFLDQSGHLGGAELCLLDIARFYGESCRVALFSAGSFQQRLTTAGIPVSVLAEQDIQVRKEGSLRQGLSNLGHLIPLICKVSRFARHYDLIYANTPKALIVGVIAAILSRRRLVYHLHDIVSPDHFSKTNCRIIITLANQAALVIANSQSSREAFIQAGGRTDRLHVVYNGFRLEDYPDCVDRLGREERKIFQNKLFFTEGRQESDTSSFIVGHFSRLSPWKGQHVLIEALQYCPDNVIALFIGDALFGEQDYVQQLHQKVKKLNLEHRVKFLGFRSDIPQLMSACDLVAHTSTAPEPFGRVIAEAMLCSRPVVAAAAGGAVEIVEHDQTGWLTPPGDARKLADVIKAVYCQPEKAEAIASSGRAMARQRFNTGATVAQIDQLLEAVL